MGVYNGVHIRRWGGGGEFSGSISSHSRVLTFRVHATRRLSKSKHTHTRTRGKNIHERKKGKCRSSDPAATQHRLQLRLQPKNPPSSPDAIPPPPPLLILPPTPITTTHPRIIVTAALYRAPAPPPPLPIPHLPNSHQASSTARPQTRASSMLNRVLRMPRLQSARQIAR